MKKSIPFLTVLVLFILLVICQSLENHKEMFITAAEIPAKGSLDVFMDEPFLEKQIIFQKEE